MWRRVGCLDVPFRRRGLCSRQAAHLLHQLREVPVGGQHQPHEEAGLRRHTEEDDHHQVAKLNSCQVQNHLRVGDAV